MEWSISQTLDICYCFKNNFSFRCNAFFSNGNSEYSKALLAFYFSCNSFRIVTLTRWNCFHIWTIQQRISIHHRLVDQATIPTVMIFWHRCSIDPQSEKKKEPLSAKEGKTVGKNKQTNVIMYEKIELQGSWLVGNQKTKANT